MSLLSAQRKTVTLSPPLPISNTHLSAAGVTFRRSQFSIVAAGPGVGKSLWATNIAVRTPGPCMFFSADSDEWTVRTRACAILTGNPLETVEKQLNDPAWETYYADVLRTADHVDWCYRSDIETEFIVSRLSAYAEMRGDYPHLIVVDNLANTVQDQDNEYAELRGTCRELQRIARNTQAHVMALHHVKGAKESGTQPIGTGDLLGNLGKIPEVVIGLNRETASSVGVTVPKNRGGRSGLTLSIPLDYTTATVGGFT